MVGCKRISGSSGPFRSSSAVTLILFLLFHSFKIYLCVPSLLAAHFNNRDRRKLTFSPDVLKFHWFRVCTVMMAAVELERFTHRLTFSVHSRVNTLQDIVISSQQYIPVTLSQLQRMGIMVFRPFFPHYVCAFLQLTVKIIIEWKFLLASAKKYQEFCIFSCFVWIPSEPAAEAKEKDASEPCLFYLHFLLSSAFLLFFFTKYVYLLSAFVVCLVEIHKDIVNFKSQS